MSDQSLSVIVPAYNEAERLKVTLPKLVEFSEAIEIIIVNDGSSDTTGDVIKSYMQASDKLRLINLEQNSGKGAALQAGVAEAKGELILISDCDLSTPLSDFHLLNSSILSGFDIAIGSRALKKEAVTINAKTHRKLIGRTFSLFVNTITGLPFKDTQCGFKLFKKEAGKALFRDLKTMHFAFDVELLLRAERKGLSIDEVPVNWKHVSGSKVNLISDSIRMAKDIILIRFKLCRS